MKQLLSSLLVLFLALSLSACADKMFSDSDSPSSESSSLHAEEAPRQGKLRHPGLMDRATTQESGVAGKYGAQNAHLFLAFNEYEADGVTRRVLDSYGITRRILQEYGVTRRILEEYGVTRRILEEYGITRRIINEYGGLTWELLEEHGITRRIGDQYGVTRRILEEYEETFEPIIELRVRINNARPGITIVFGSDLLDVFLDEIADDTDIELIEPDAEFSGAPLYLRDGFRHSDQMVPWNIASVNGVFTDYDHEDVEVFLLDSGIYDRDLKIVEAKDFTMLFENRHEETWDDSAVMEMAYFDPGEMGDPVDRNGHGTHGAGTIGAKDNDEGIKGLAPEARIHSLKVLTDDGKTDITTVVSAIDYVTDFKQKNPTTPVVANMSLGMDLESTSYNILDEAVKRAVDFGVVVVVSAGNDAVDASTYSPAHVYEAITVGAYDRNDQMAYFSNYGSTIDLFAPGDAVVSLTHLESEADNDDNVLLSGTSSAAPHVTAAVALYLQNNPYASPADVEQALINAADSRVQGVPSGTTDRALNVGFADDGRTKDFRVMKSEWHVSDSGVKKLKLEGEGPRLDRVTLTNAGRRNVLADMAINDEGKWKYEVTDPDQVPCFVDIEYHGGTRDAEAGRYEVEYAPGSCDPVLTLTQAKWDDGNLVVQGRAVEGLNVEIWDAQLGTLLIELPADDDNKFKLDSDSMPEPCRVSATIDGESVEMEVEDADEDDCSGGQGLSRPVSFRKAEYDPEKDKLKIEGDSSPGVTVSLKSAASGNEIASMEVANNGRFKFEITEPSIIPCDALVEASDGYSHTGTIIKRGTTSAPSDCERSLVLEEVKWETEGNGRLKIKGRGLFYNDVVVKDARTGTHLATATADNRGKFEEQFTGLPIIPCAVIIESQEAELRVLRPDVAEAPYNCDVDLRFTMLQHRSNPPRLSAGGMATAGSVVTLVDTATRAELAQVPVQVDRTWRTDMDLSESGSQPPCSVEAHSENGEVQVATVSPLMGCTNEFAYVPVEVELEQNPYSFIELSGASWRADTRDLQISGEGYEFMTVTITNPYNGEVLATFENDDTPSFQFITGSTDVAPCEVVAELDGREATRIVSNTPENCNDGPYLGEVEWTGNRLDVSGMGGLDFGFALASTVRGEFGTGSIDGDGYFSASYQESDLAWIPCEIAMTSNDQTVVKEVDGAPNHCDGVLDVQEATYNNGRLVFEAAGAFGAAFELYSSARPGELVYGSNFDSGGTVDLQLDGEDGLPFFPSELFIRYKVEASAPDFVDTTFALDNVPSHADGEIDVDQVRWNNGELEIALSGSYNETLTLSSVGNGRTVGTIQTDDLGFFDDSATDLSFVPCTLLLTSDDGRTAQAIVGNAPLFCDDKAWLDFDKAEYKVNEKRLTLEGEGFGRNGETDLEVSFAYADGEVFHSEEMDDGEWSIQLNNIKPEDAPCTVTVTLDNADPFTLAVHDAPGNCR